VISASHVAVAHADSRAKKVELCLESGGTGFASPCSCYLGYTEELGEEIPLKETNQAGSGVSLILALSLFLELWIMEWNR
jgi:hypothetical protein